MINVLIAVLIVALGGAVYWYALRPLPKVSGSIEAPIQARATVRRDARGIPHIEAGSWQDALFVQGYVTAQDRLWQMDGLRRFAAGELAEVFGAAALGSDEQSRQLRLRAIAELDAARTTPEERAAFIAYARGVDYFIRTHRGNYSLEFSLPGHAYDPRPWRMIDSILVGLVMYRDLTDSATLDLERGELFAKAADPTRIHQLFPAVQGNYVSPGSNAWAVSGAHTASGKAMLANDPHLAYSIPSIWYLVHIKAPGLDVSGASMPGVPGILIGHNEHIAWGITSLEADSVDLYREQLDPRTGRYQFQGHTEQAQLDSQAIGVRGEKPTILNTWVTRHGPIVSNDGKGNIYSLRWTAADGFSFPFFEMARARTWPEFRTAALRLFGPALNFVYADDGGNIGFQVAGRVPIRRNFDGETPVDGASGNFEWDGYIPPDQLPSIYNPPGGIVATGNQNPFPPGYPYLVPGSFHSRYRVNQIRNLLSANPKLDVPSMLAIQKDVYSAYDRFLAQTAVAAAAHRPPSDPLVRDALTVLRNWNGQMEKSDAAPVITQFMSDNFGLSLVVPAIASPPNPVSRPRSRLVALPAPFLRPRPEIIEDLLRRRPTGWIPGNNWDAWILDILKNAVQRGRAAQGTPVSSWRWGRVLQWNFAHPVGKQLPFLDRYFDIGPFP